MKVFVENQRFTQSWLIILLAISTLAPMYLIINEYAKENTTMSFNEFIFAITLIPICISIVFIFKLKTRIDEIGIHYQFYPFHLSFKTINWQELEKAIVRKYQPISEYGGWGFRTGFGRKRGKAFSITGNIGLQLILKNGKKLLIGSQKEQELTKVLETYQHKILPNEI